MNTLRSFLAAVAWLLLLHVTFAQSGKSFFKEGEALRQQGQLDQAVEKYTLAVQVDPKFLKAYEARADVYALLGKKAACAADRKRVAELDPGDAEHAAAAAAAYMDAGDNDQALALCETALKVDAKCMPALQTKVRASLAKGDIDHAVSTADAALAQKATVDTYFLHGLAHKAARDYRTAETDFDKVIEWSNLYEPAYVAEAETQLELYKQYSGLTMQMRTLEKAIATCTHALELNTMSTDALFTRSKAYGLQKEYAKAIDDVSHVISLGRETPEVYLQRASYYKDFGQFQNAVNDLNRTILAEPKNVDALTLRAECKEANLDPEGAQKDLELVEKAMEGDDRFTAEDRRKVADHKTQLAKQIFEMNRESDPPVITVVEPMRKGEVVQVGSALLQVKVNGHVRDRNLLKSVRVNGQDADYAKDEKDPEFFISVPIAPSTKSIDVEATDLYDNVATVSLKVERTESTPPALALTSPAAEPDRAITIDADKDDVFLEGTASDASGIRSVTVDGVFASFAPDTTATDFSIKLPVKGKDHFTLRAEDQFGNATETVYQVRRRAPAVVEKPVEHPATEKPVPDRPATEKPVSSTTGVTWVVLIENSDYKSFPAPEGQAADLSDIQRSFGKYNVQRTITKKNMTKGQIERFFNIELRDQVRTNHVNTILVGYVGHGRSVAGKTYWVPIDGRKDDIYTCYNYGSLKSLLENYSESVTNTLVVSKAAGTDPSFYELTR